MSAEKPVCWLKRHKAQIINEVVFDKAAGDAWVSQFEPGWAWLEPLTMQPAQQAQQEPVEWRETHSKVIKALAAIVAVHTPDKLLSLDAIPRDPVMGLVHQIRVAIDGYKQPQRKPLTDEEIEDVTRKAADALLDHIYEYGTCAEGTLYRIHAIAKAVESAHGIKENT